MLFGFDDLERVTSPSTPEPITHSATRAIRARATDKERLQREQRANDRAGANCRGVVERECGSFVQFILGELSDLASRQECDDDIGSKRNKKNDEECASEIWRHEQNRKRDSRTNCRDNAAG